MQAGDPRRHRVRRQSSNVPGKPAGSAEAQGNAKVAVSGTIGKTILAFRHLSSAVDWLLEPAMLCCVSLKLNCVRSVSVPRSTADPQRERLSTAWRLSP